MVNIFELILPSFKCIAQFILKDEQHLVTRYALLLLPSQRGNGVIIDTLILSLDLLKDLVVHLQLMVEFVQDNQWLCLQLFL